MCEKLLEDARYKVRNNLVFSRPFCEVLINRRMPDTRYGNNLSFWRPFCEALENRRFFGIRFSVKAIL